MTGHDPPHRRRCNARRADTYSGTPIVERLSRQIRASTLATVPQGEL